MKLSVMQQKMEMKKIVKGPVPFRNSEILKENSLEKEKYWKISEFHAVDTVYASDPRVFTTTFIKNIFFFRNKFVSLFLYLDSTVYEYYYKIKALRIFFKVQETVSATQNTFFSIICDDKKTA